jgi:hypothetical protein
MALKLKLVCCFEECEPLKCKYNVSLLGWIAVMLPYHSFPSFVLHVYLQN